jgi:hypothetical protein
VKPPLVGASFEYTNSEAPTRSAAWRATFGSARSVNFMRCRSAIDCTWRGWTTSYRPVASSSADAFSCIARPRPGASFASTTGGRITTAARSAPRAVPAARRTPRNVLMGGDHSARILKEHDVSTPEPEWPRGKRQRTPRQQPQGQAVVLGRARARPAPQPRAAPRHREGALRAGHRQRLPAGLAEGAQPGGRHATRAIARTAGSALNAALRSPDTGTVVSAPLTRRAALGAREPKARGGGP